ncbi:hypothetical protein HY490_02575 [Candidatus Woesearchaeota archaeon]|nr:hypothetical protein [Candidatus Woesearchaeota archaeon]
MLPVQWIPRSAVRRTHEQHPEAYFYDTSTRAPLANDLDYVIAAPEFSPFVAYGGIPIPGTTDVSDSVEGIWQGLKVIRGKIDPSYFEGKGRKRRGKPWGHLFGGRVIGYRDARVSIYVPSYEFMVEQRVSGTSVDSIVDKAASTTQFFFDVDENGDVHDTRRPLSHAAILVRWLNGEITRRQRLREFPQVDSLQAQE